MCVAVDSDVVQVLEHRVTTAEKELQASTAMNVFQAFVLCIGRSRVRKGPSILSFFFSFLC